MASGTAIYLSERAAIAVRVEGSAKKPKLVRAAELIFELPTSGEDGLPVTKDEIHESRVAQLRAWVKRAKIGGEVALCIDPSSVILRDLRVEFTERRQIDKVIGFQVEGVIPSTPVEDLAIGYSILEKDAEGSRLLISAAHRAALHDLADTLEEAGVDSSYADSTIGGALNLRALTPSLAKVDRPTLWIDFQGSNAVIAVLQGESLLSLRSIRVPVAAVEELEQAAVERVAEPASDADSDDDSFQAIVIEDDDPIAERPEAATTKAKATAAAESGPSGNALSRLVVIEARRSILGAQVDGPIERVVLSGVPHALHRAVGAVGAELGVPNFELLDLLEPMVPKTRKGEAKVDLPASLLIPSIAGVACRKLGVNGSNIDFLTGDLSPSSTFDLVKVPLALAATVMFMVTGVLLMLVLKERQWLEKEAPRIIETETELDAKFSKAYANAPAARRAPFPEYTGLTAIDAIEAAHDKMIGDIRDLKAGAKSNFPPLVEADRVLNEVVEKLLTVLGEPAQGGATNINHFWLKNYVFKQDAASGTRPTSGSLVLECYIENAPEPLRFKVEAALLDLEVDNPAWDGIDQSKRKIKLFSQVRANTDPTKIYPRGQRKVKGVTTDITIQHTIFECKLTEMQRRVEKTGTTSTRIR